jgi:hypothetical protein
LHEFGDPDRGFSQWSLREEEAQPFDNDSDQPIVEAVQGPRSPRRPDGPRRDRLGAPEPGRQRTDRPGHQAPSAHRVLTAFPEKW